MNIYQSTKVLPYVYMCREKGSPYFYIGYRFRNFVPSSEDFGKHYFTSNKYVKTNFENFDWIIVAEFFNQKDALKFESQLIRETSSEFQLNRKRLSVNSRKKRIQNYYYQKPSIKKIKLSIQYRRFKKEFLGPILTKNQAKYIRESLEKRN